ASRSSPPRRSPWPRAAIRGRSGWGLGQQRRPTTAPTPDTGEKLAARLLPIPQFRHPCREPQHPEPTNCHTAINEKRARVEQTYDLADETEERTDAKYV